MGDDSALYRPTYTAGTEEENSQVGICTQGIFVSYFLTNYTNIIYMTSVIYLIFIFAHCASHLNLVAVN